MYISAESEKGVADSAAMAADLEPCGALGPCGPKNLVIRRFSGDPVQHCFPFQALFPFQAVGAGGGNPRPFFT